MISGESLGHYLLPVLPHRTCPGGCKGQQQTMMPRQISNCPVLAENYLVKEKYMHYTIFT